MNKENKNVVTFRSTQIKTLLLTRDSSAGHAAERDLDRYYKILERSLRSVKLTMPEACLLCDLFNGTIFTPELSAKQQLLLSLDDCFAVEYADKWDTCQNALSQKLKEYDEFQCLAVIDAIERFWYDPESSSIPNIEEKIELVGLAVKPETKFEINLTARLNNQEDLELVSEAIDRSLIKVTEKYQIVGRFTKSTS